MRSLSHKTIYTLPDGYVIWPGVLFNPKTNNPATPKGQDAFTLHALDAVYGAKDNMPEKMRQAADQFIDAALEHLSSEHGEDLMLIFPNDPKNGRDDNPPGNR